MFPRGHPDIKSRRSVLSRRNEAIVPVGAWVELAPLSQQQDYEVFVSAQIEEERISCRQREKEARLVQFQKDVRERVREAKCRQREQRLQEASHSLDLEQRILQRSRQVEGQRNGGPVYREEPIQISRDKEDPAVGACHGENLDPDHLVNLSKKIGGLVKMAKRDLASRMVLAEKSNIPGGMWRQSFTRDTADQWMNSAQGDNTTMSGNEPPRIPLNTDMASYDVTPGDLGTSANPGTSLDPGSCGEPSTIGNLDRGHMSEITQQRLHPQNERTKAVTFDTDVENMSTSSENPKQVNRHQGSSIESKDERTKHGGCHVANDPRSKVDRRIGRHPEAIGLKPRNVDEEKKRQTREVAAYRRLFMDMERQEVQENRRKKQHNKHIQRLKKAKEEECLAIERQCEMAAEPIDPATGLTGVEMIEDRQRHERRVEAELERCRERDKRDRETKRYIRALHAQMKERMDRLGIVLPPLCPCGGATAWDSHPDNCANNCIFYRNPRAYAKALTSLINNEMENQHRGQRSSLTWN